MNYKRLIRLSAIVKMSRVEYRQALRRNIFLLCLLQLLWGATPARATSHVPQDSRVTGKVVVVVADEKREPQAGVVVTLTSELLRGRVLRAESDEEGNYSFGELIAGDYTIVVESQDFARYEQKVSVQIGAVVELNILLKLREVSEKVDVTGETSGLETEETNQRAEISSRVLREAPLINERFQDALPLLPGVVRAPDGSLAIKGARASQSGLLVSSLNVTDPVTGSAAINLPLEAVENVQVYANPYSAEFGKFTGAVTSVETRSGTNRFRYLVTHVIVRPRFRDGGIYGVQAATPRIAVGGPIIKDKLFFFQTLEYRFVRTEVPSLPAAARDQQLESFDSFTRLDYNINARNRLTASFSIFPQKQEFFTLNTFNPRETTPNLHQRGFFFAINEQAVFRSGALLQSNVSVKQFDVDVFSNSGAPYVITPGRFTGGFFNRQHRESRRYEVLETFNVPTQKLRGEHDLRLGVNLTRTEFAGTDTSNPVHLVRRDGRTSELIEFAGDGRLARNSTEISFFAQDRWTPINRLTFDLGVRYDRDGIGKRNNFSPRAGFVLVPDKEARTVIRGGIGVFYDKIPLGVGVFEQRQQFVVTRFAADGNTPLDAQRTFRNVIANDGLRNPRSIAGNIQVDRELTKALLLRVGFSERRTSRDFVVEPVRGFQTAAGATPIDALLLSNTGEARYRELELTTQLRLQERRSLNISYVRSRATGDLNDFDTYFGNARNPVIRANERGNLGFDAPHRLLFTGAIEAKDFVFSPVVDWRSGFPYSILDEEQNFVGRRNAGGRFPRFFSTDLQVTKGVRIPVPKFKFIPQKFRGKPIGGRVGVKLFNITNHFNPRDVQNNLGALDYGAFYNSVRRSFRLKFEFVKF